MPFLAVHLSFFPNGNLLRVELLLEFIHLYLPGVDTENTVLSTKGIRGFFFFPGVEFE